MTDFQPATPAEAHPTRHEYVLERAIGDGDWVVESITPAPTPDEAEERAASFTLPWIRDKELRVVRRTITSTVISVRPPRAPDA